MNATIRERDEGGGFASTELTEPNDEDRTETLKPRFHPPEVAICAGFPSFLRVALMRDRRGARSRIFVH